MDAVNKKAAGFTQRLLFFLPFPSSRRALEAVLPWSPERDEPPLHPSSGRGLGGRSNCYSALATS